MSLLKSNIKHNVEKTNVMAIAREIIVGKERPIYKQMKKYQKKQQVLKIQVVRYIYGIENNNFLGKMTYSKICLGVKSIFRPRYWRGIKSGDGVEIDRTESGQILRYMRAYWQNEGSRRIKRIQETRTASKKQQKGVGKNIGTRRFCIS